MTTATVPDLATQWRRQWPAALAVWSRFTRLRDPRLCATSEEAKAAGLDGSFAMIRLTDQLVVIDLEQVATLGLGDLAIEVMAHEVGHHILCPATLSAQGRMIARMRWALPGVEAAAPSVANLYADLHINDRLQRSSGLRLDEVYRRLRAHGGDDDSSDLWRLYQRIYEILWALRRGDLTTRRLPDRIEGDAQLGSRLVRAYRTDWLDGAGGFAALCLPYLTTDADAKKALGQWSDALDAAGGQEPDGLTDMDPSERAPVHPSRDPRVTDVPVGARDEPAPPPAAPSPGGGQQHREPFEYGQVLRALGLDLDDHEIAVRYYREAAAPYLIPFPSRLLPRRGDLVPEGYGPWSLGEPIGDIDWLGTVLRSPRVVPGVTTVRRIFGPDEDTPPRPEPLDLDIYVDSSGSMPNPQVTFSFLALAGIIISLSCLRAGGRVQATLWSGPGEFDTSAGFITDRTRILRIITGSIQSSTAFPIHILRDTYANRSPEDRPVHILVISDNGVTTMFDRDEKGNDGVAIARQALERARGGGTMVLQGIEWMDLSVATGMGWVIEPIGSWDELLAFARRFSRRTYGDERDG